MSKHEHSKHDVAAQIAESIAAEEPPPEPTPCAVCGQSDGEFETVVKHIRAHAQCAAKFPDVIAKVKARA